MKFVAVALFGVLCGVNAGAADKAHPIVKVIKLVQGLKDTSISEGKDEAVANTKFEYWCSTTKATLKEAISDENESIDELNDKIAGLNKEKESLEEDIKALQEQIKELQASATAAKKDRQSEAALYKTTDADLKKTITAVAGCITALSGAEKKTETMMLAQGQVKTLIALISLKATETQVQTLKAFVDGKPKQLAQGDANQHVDKYNFKSENVIELLKNLQTKFEDDRLAGTKAETNALNAYSLSKRARDNAIKAANKSKGKKTTELGNTKNDITSSTKELKSTKKDLKDDSKSLSDAVDSCNLRKDEWNTRSETRRLEIEAMDKAIEILSKSTGVRTEAPGNPVPPPSPVFLQVSSSSDPKMKAVALLRQVAKETSSRALDRLAVEVAAHLNGPFDAVNNMIEKMIFRLMDEQKKEDEHKLWCDEEIEKTTAMQDDKKAKIKDLKAQIAFEVAEVGKLGNDITTAQNTITDIVAFENEATAIRKTGKQENALAIKDAKQAQTSLSNAIAVLEAFYKESGAIKKEPWEFIQAEKAPVKVGAKPKVWGKPYTGVAGGGSSIVAILEGVQGDFSKMEAETKAQEASDQKAYDDDMKANAIEKAGRKQAVEMKTAEETRRNEKIESLSGTQKDTEGELEKTDQYYEDLKPACMDGDSKYGDRKAARAKEIKALKDAQETLLNAFNDKKSAKFLQIHSHVQ